MKIDQLTYFSETARLQHVGKASRSLNISPSAISHSIRGLEKELGCQLFKKQGKNIYLTAHGKKLYKKALELISLTNKIKEDLKSEAIEWEGSYRMAVTHALADCFFVPKWNAFQRNHPNLHIELYNLRSSQVIEFAAKGEIDFGVCFNPLPHPNIHVENIMEQPLVIGVRKGHPLSQKKGTPLKAISTYPCSSPKAFQGIEICENHPELKKYGITPKIDFIFDSYESAVARIQGTDSWALLPKILIEKYGLVALTSPEWQAKAVIAAVWPKDRLLSRTLEEFKFALANKKGRPL